jgi:hypothetical protein
MTPLKIVKPQPVTDAVLIATDVPESSFPVWSAGTSYALGARVHLVSTHKVYESTIAGNIGNNPASAVQWVEVGPTNRWAVFDRSNSTATTKSTSFFYRLLPSGAFNAVALLGLVGAQTLRVRVTHPTLGLIFDRTVGLTGLPEQVGWWEWFFGQRIGPSLSVMTDLPGLPGSELRVDVTGATNLAAGVLLFGSAKDIGLLVQQGARLGIQDYSRKETNEFGDLVLVQRAFAKRATFDVPIKADFLDESINFLTSIRATPCLFIAPRYESGVIYGFYKEFDVNIAYASVSECSLQVEGLT